MRIRRVTWAVALMLVASTMLSNSAWAKLNISGYSQARYNMEDDGPDEFDLRSVRLKVTGPVNDKGTEVKIQIDLGKLDDDGGDVELKDAILIHPLSDQWSTRVGFSTVPFGFEVGYSSSKRLPLERSRIAAKKLFPGERDTGIYFFRAAENRGQPEFVIGYSNGMRKWRRDDADEEADSFVARVQWPLANNGVAGLSYRTADRTVAGGSSHRADVLGAHVRWNGPNGFSFQGEYYDGERVQASEDRLNDIDGWYSQLEYSSNESAATLFYRYEECNEFHEGSRIEDYDRHTFGVAWDLEENERITVQWESLDNNGNSEDNIGVQWQFKY